MACSLAPVIVANDDDKRSNTLIVLTNLGRSARFHGDSFVCYGRRTVGG